MSKLKINWFTHFIELLVVIIGVTVAFAINNWAEKRKLDKEEKHILQSFYDDLSRDYHTFHDIQIPVNMERAKNLKHFIGLIATQSVKQDTLKKYLYDVLLSTSNYTINRTTFESLKYSGKMDLIKNLDLKKKIYWYYSKESQNSEFAVKAHIDYRKENILPYLGKKLNFNQMNTDFLYDLEFSNHLYFYLKSFEVKLNEYELLAQRSNELSNMLEEELKKF